jgi:Uma2 family endonuclease
MIAHKQKGTQPMTIQHEHWISLEEYHEIERNSDIKYEYSDGRIYDMSGGSYAHSEIAINVTTALKTHLRGKVCRVVNSDLKVLPLGDENPSYYPDVTVTCNPEDYTDDSTAVRSPRLIMEVLSPSTTYRDRGEKLRVYKACATMEEYIMVSTRRQEIEVYRRVGANKWENTLYTVEQEVTLVSVGLTIPVSEFYADTNVPPHASVLSAD